MRVRVHDVDQATMMVATASTEADLTECFDDPDERADVQAELERDGWTYVGGGAAPLTMLTVIRD